MDNSLGIFGDLYKIGGMFYIYALARFIHFWVLDLYDKNEKSNFATVLAIICGILWLLSFPVSIIMYGVNYFHNGFTESQHTKEMIKKSNEDYARIKETEIRPLQEKIENLEGDLSFAIGSAKLIASKNYALGYDAGFENGFEKCLDCTYYSEEEKESLRAKHLDSK